MDKICVGKYEFIDATGINRDYYIKCWNKSMKGMLIAQYISNDLIIIGRLISKRKFEVIGDNYPYDNLVRPYNCDGVLSDECYFITIEEAVSILL